jgi:putative transposase
MRTILSAIVLLLTLRLRSRRSLELEIIALRHQITILKRKKKMPPQFTRADRFIWSWMYFVCPAASKWMRITAPKTVVTWRTRQFHHLRRRPKLKTGLPSKVTKEMRRLMGRMYRENTGWGENRIHGELQKLGYEIGQTTIHNHLAKHGAAPTPGWRTFLHNHRKAAPAFSAFGVVAIISFRLLHTLMMVALDRAKVKILHSNYMETNGKIGFVDQGSQAVVKLPWSKSLVSKRNSCDGRNSKVHRQHKLPNRVVKTDVRIRNAMYLH